MSFHNLPTELRNYIYGLSLPKHELFTIFIAPEQSIWSDPPLPGLLDTSTSIRNEIKRSFYSTNKFKIWDMANSNTGMPHWVHKIHLGPTIFMERFEILVDFDYKNQYCNHSRGLFITVVVTVKDGAMHAHATKEFSCNRFCVPGMLEKETLSQCYELYRAVHKAIDVKGDKALQYPPTSAADFSMNGSLNFTDLIGTSGL